MHSVAWLPGASVTVTAVTRATQVGDVVNCVEVGSEEIESDYLNNTACGAGARHRHSAARSPTAAGPLSSRRRLLQAARTPSS